MNHVTNIMSELLLKLTDVFAEGILWARFQGVAYDGKEFSCNNNDNNNNGNNYNDNKDDNNTYIFI